MYKQSRCQSVRTNYDGNSIEKHVEDGRTLVFKNESQAKKKADELRSYYYAVYENGSSNGEYAVPK